MDVMAKKVLGRKGLVSAWIAVGLAIAALAPSAAAGIGYWDKGTGGQGDKGSAIPNSKLKTENSKLSQAQFPIPNSQFPILILVNSNEDGPVQADSQLTLREAIEIANGTLPLEELSEAEKANISLTDNPPGETTIAFDLDPEQTEIKLVELLPAIAKPGLTIDGTTQPFGELGIGHGAWRMGTTPSNPHVAMVPNALPSSSLDPMRSPQPPFGRGAIAQCSMPPTPNPSQEGSAQCPIPVVSITPIAPVETDVNKTELFRGIEREAAIAEATNGAPRRGLTIMADRVTIRGLMLYGFRDSPAQMLQQSGSSSANIVTNTPAADILIVSEDWLEVGDNSEPAPTPKNILIENNWLGIAPFEREPNRRSGFGVFVYNGTNVTVRQNQIAYHDGSGIITGVQAENLQIEENIIFANGLAGMPDAIRLEGNIANTRLTGNVISENDGAGIFLFKPSGSVSIEDNEIIDNGRRLRRAAVYLMGSGHQVRNNQIASQPGPGVVVAADGKNRRNFIIGNRFDRLDGLSIDLNTRLHQDASHYQIGDGPNPQRDTGNRRKGTGNGAINAPVFLAREFYIMDDGRVRIDGIADPGSTVEIYRVSSNSEQNHGPLTEPVATVETDAQGRFGIVGAIRESPLRETPLREGDRVSAIATHPDYGTSEPARNAAIRELEF